MEKLKIPIRVLEDWDSGITYSNPGIQAAMDDALPTILTIARKVHCHPLWDVYQQWTEANGSLGRNLRLSSEFMTAHSVPILPGDAGLSEPFLARLLQMGVQDSGTTVFVIAQILFHLVILRTYLGLQPSHDAHIWRTWRSGAFKRRYTPAERVLQACTTIRIGVGVDGSIESRPNTGSHFKIVPCSEDCVDADTLLIEHPEVNWLESSEQMLSGQGVHHAEESSPKCRGRPRPVKRAPRPLSDPGR